MNELISFQGQKVKVVHIPNMAAIRCWLVSSWNSFLSLYTGCAHVAKVVRCWWQPTSSTALHRYFHRLDAFHTILLLPVIM